jgi:hypothetical protein
MADFHRFYNHGLEHTVHLEELERSASGFYYRPVGSRQKSAAVRRWLARALTTFAERIDPANTSRRGKTTHAVS